jgi:hypothetical protein
MPYSERDTEQAGFACRAHIWREDQTPLVEVQLDAAVKACSVSAFGVALQEIRDRNTVAF